MDRGATGDLGSRKGLSSRSRGHPPWCHRLNGHEFGWTPGVGDRQGGLACCGPWGHKASDTIERLN